MCFGTEAGWVPAVVAGLSAAATGAGTYSAAKANKAQVEAGYSATAADRFRQAEIQRQADAELRQKLGQFETEPVKEQVDQATAARTAAYTPPAAAPTAQYQASTPAAPAEVKSEAARKVDEVMKRATEEAARRARLGAYGDVSQAQRFGLNRLGESFRQLQANSRGSTNVMNAEAGLPATAAQGWRNRADTANLIGQIGSLYAMGAGKKKPSIGYGTASNPYDLGQTDGPY
jgi:hypothetical protein